MTDQTPEQPPAEGTPSLSELSARVDAQGSKLDQILGMLSGSGASSPSAEPAPADPKAEMRAELAKLQRAEAAKKARASERQANDARLKAIEDKISEKPPEEYSKITNFMRWRDKPKEKQA